MSAYSSGFTDESVVVGYMKNGCSKKYENIYRKYPTEDLYLTSSSHTCFHCQFLFKLDEPCGKMIIDMNPC